MLKVTDQFMEKNAPAELTLRQSVSHKQASIVNCGQHQDPTPEDIKFLNKRLEWQMKNQNKGVNYEVVKLRSAKAYVSADASFANTQSLLRMKLQEKTISLSTAMSSIGARLKADESHAQFSHPKCTEWSAELIWAWSLVQRSRLQTSSNFLRSHLSSVPIHTLCTSAWSSSERRRRSVSWSILWRCANRTNARAR